MSKKTKAASNEGAKPEVINKANLYHETALIALASLKPHPRNYRKHPEDEINHIIASIKTHGFYKNIVVARDLTILAGHGVVEAAKRMQLEKVPVVRLKLTKDDPRALQIVAADNEIGHLADNDDGMLAKLLTDVKDSVSIGSLMGTGFDDAMLANLLFSARPADPNAAPDNPDNLYFGMPEFKQQDQRPWKTLKVHFRNTTDLAAFAKLVKQKMTEKTKFVWYPKADIEPIMDKRTKSEK
jgi:hypothetical protein